VVVERHRFDAYPLGERAHGERADPSLVGERDGALEEALAVEGSTTNVTHRL
jgi:hypothetical protein